jgi:integrase
MPRITKPLTDTEIKAAKAVSKDITLQDGKGLFLLVTQIGTKLWRLRYQHPATGKRKLLGIGAYPALTLSKARIKRDEALNLLSSNIDPKLYWEKVSKQDKAINLNTFGIVAKQWLDIKKTEVSEDHAIDIWRSIENNVFPLIKNTPITDITARLLIESLEPVKARGALETVRRLCQRINEIMNYAANTGLIDANPASGISKAFQKPVKANLPTLPPEQLPDFLTTLSNASIGIQTRCVIEWQLHTMVRPSEASGACWDEINFTTNEWHIPKERMKKKKAHIVPLTMQAISILNVMRGISGGREFIFPSSKAPRMPMNSSTANMAIKRMGYHGQLVAHGLRSIASTVLNEHGFDPDVIESALAHVDSNETRRAYNRTTYLERRRKIMEWWSDYIDQAATGKVTISGDYKGLRVIGN